MRAEDWVCLRIITNKYYSSNADKLSGSQQLTAWSIYLGCNCKSCQKILLRLVLTVLLIVVLIYSWDER